MEEQQAEQRQRDRVSLRLMASALDLEAGVLARHAFERLSSDLPSALAGMPSRQDPRCQEFFLDEDWAETLEPTFFWRYTRELARVAASAADAWGDIVVGELARTYADAEEPNPACCER